MGGLDAVLDGLNRGRNRAPTPIQGSETAPDEEAWYVLLFRFSRRHPHLCPRSSLLLPGESVVFNTTVEKSALRRRASRLLAIAGGAPRRKTRELVLTDRRLLCVKHKPKQPFQLSNEFLLRSTDSRDVKNTVVGVEPKGEREIVVMTVRVPGGREPRGIWANVRRYASRLLAQGSKSYPYITSSASLASTWIRKIREAVEAQASGNTNGNNALQQKNGASNNTTRT